MKPILILFLIFGAASVVLGQQPTDQKTIRYVVSDPEVIKLEVLPRRLNAGEESSVLAQPYTHGDKLYFRLRMTNISLLPAEIPIDDPYSQNRLLLYKDGDLVAYRKEIDELLKARDKEPSEHVMGWRAQLGPNESRVIDRFNLNDWYDDLGPGHYQLSVRHRFQIGQEWYESASITFEIVPKKHAKERGQE
ncbi:MAG TPA: hypothetical protein VMZ30_01150 [Pyrinomonadaceae bacterium]|nr:hypothetical protein [Pyrinomonadaceae bacterium]